MSLNTLDCPRCGAPLDPPVPAGKTMECPYCKNTVVIPEALRSQEPTHQKPQPTPVDLAKVTNLLRSGKKLDAIRLLRETTFLSLKEAVDAVDSLERGEPVEIFTYKAAAPTFVSRDPQLDAAAFSSQPDLETELRTLLKRGERVAAIQLLRERQDLSLGVADTTLSLLAKGTPLTDALAQADWQSIKQRIEAQAARPRTPQETARQRAAMKAVTASSVGGCSLFFILIILFAVVLPLGMVGFALLMPDGPFGEIGSRLNPLAFARLEASFGKEGSGQGYFENLRLLAPAPDGSVYTVENESGRIQHFDATGKFLNLWFVPGTENLDEVYIEDLVVGPDGRVYVLTRGEILIYDGSSGALLLNLQPQAGEQRLRINQLAFGPDGTPYALSDRETLVRFDAAWQPEILAEEIIDSVTKDSESSPHLILDGSGLVYVLGSSNQAVFKYDRQGAYINSFGSKGEAKGQFDYAHELAIDRYGRIFVGDSDGILVFNADGLFLRQFAIPGVAYDLAIDAQNRMWIANSNQRVLRYTLTAP